MKLIEPQSPEIWRQEPGFIGLCEHIARCAAICYDSKPKTGGAAVDFVKRLIAMGHGRALEFGTLYFANVYLADFEDYKCYVHIDPRDGESAWVNLRVALRTFGNIDAVEECCDNLTEDIDKSPRVTVHYPAIARSIADEFRTHTTISTLMQSTRYVKQGKDGDVEFVCPSFFEKSKLDVRTRMIYAAALSEAEYAYSALIESGCKPQDAREVLPLCVKTEMVQCGIVGDENSGWDNFLHLRTAKDAHPDAQWMAKEVHRILNEEAATIKF